MKQKYTKPAMVMERFELSQSIAAGCGASADGTLGNPNLHSKSTCGWDMGNQAIWTGDNQMCDFEWTVEGEISGVCYNNPEGGYNIFSSY